MCGLAGKKILDQIGENPGRTCIRGLFKKSTFRKLDVNFSLLRKSEKSNYGKIEESL